MTLTVEKLICAKCGTEHDSVPLVRTGVWNGVEQTGVWASEFTYVRDYYKGEYAVLCKSHDRDSISQKSMREVIAGY